MDSEERPAIPQRSTRSSSTSSGSPFPGAGSINRPPTPSRRPPPPTSTTPTGTRSKTPSPFNLSRDTENIRLTPIEAEFQRQAALLQAAKLARQPFPADAIQRSPQANRNPPQHEQPPPQDNTDDASEPDREQHEQPHQQDDPQPGPSHQNNQQDPPPPPRGNNPNNNGRQENNPPPPFHQDPFHSFNASHTPVGNVNSVMDKVTFPILKETSDPNAFRRWLRDIENIFALSSWSEEEKARLAYKHITDQAKTIIDCLCNGEEATLMKRWCNMKEVISDYFCPGLSLLNSADKERELIQGFFQPQESVFDFYFRVTSTLDEEYATRRIPKDNTFLRMRSAEIRKIFARGLNHEVKTQLKNIRPHRINEGDETPADLYRLAREAESCIKANKLSSSNQHSMNPFSTDEVAVDAITNTRSHRRTPSHPHNVPNSYPVSRSSASLRQPFSSDYSRVICLRCYLRGHQASKCRLSMAQIIKRYQFLLRRKQNQAKGITGNHQISEVTPFTADDAQELLPEELDQLLKCVHPQSAEESMPVLNSLLHHSNVLDLMQGSNLEFTPVNQVSPMNAEEIFPTTTQAPHNVNLDLPEPCPTTLFNAYDFKDLNLN